MTPEYRVCKVYDPDLGKNVYMIYDFINRVYMDMQYPDAEWATMAMLRIIADSKVDN